MKRIIYNVMFLVMLFAVAGCGKKSSDGKLSLRDELQQEAEEMIESQGEYIETEDESEEQETEAAGESEEGKTETADGQEEEETSGIPEEGESAEAPEGSVYEEAEKGDIICYSPEMDISRETIISRLEDAGYVRDEEEQDRYALKTQDEEIKVILGKKEEKELKQISFIVLKNNRPTKDKKLCEELLAGIQTVLEELGETYDKDKVTDMLESVKEKEQKEAYEYSENVIFDLFRYEQGNGYDIKLSKPMCTEVMK